MSEARRPGGPGPSQRSRSPGPGRRPGALGPAPPATTPPLPGFVAASRQARQPSPRPLCARRGSWSLHTEPVCRLSPSTLALVGSVIPSRAPREWPRRRPSQPRAPTAHPPRESDPRASPLLSPSNSDPRCCSPFLPAGRWGSALPGVSVPRTPSLSPSHTRGSPSQAPAAPAALAGGLDSVSRRSSVASIPTAPHRTCPPGLCQTPPPSETPRHSATAPRPVHVSL